MPRTTYVPKDPDTEQPRVLVAAAANMRVDSVSTRHYRSSEPWQGEAWRHYDRRGPLRYATNWFSNAISRCVLRPVKRQPDGSLEPITTGPAFDAVEELAAGSDGQSSLLKAMGQHFFIAGEWYLVGRGAQAGDITTSGDVWEVISTEEMKKVGDQWYIDYGEGQRIDLGDSDVINRMWNPHPRRRLMADSPVRAALDDLAELEELGFHIRAQVISRLAGAGLLIIPSEATMATMGDVSALAAANPNADPVLLQLVTSMMAAKNGDDAARFVPIILKMAGEFVKDVQHIRFWSDLDEKAIEMRKDAQSNLALSIDLPREVLTGQGDTNHWSAWQIDESTIKAHIEPALEVITGSITSWYLRTVVDDPTIILAADTSKLRLRPNRSKEALELGDRGIINDKAVRRETGFGEEDKPEKEDLRLWAVRKQAVGSGTPEMVMAALKELGVDLKIDPNALPDNNRQARPDPSLVDHPTTGTPDTLPDAQAASLMASCDAQVYRALERAGNRLSNRTRSKPPGVEPFDLHTLVPVQPSQLDALLEDAWTLLPKTLRGIDVDHAVVAKALDAYTRNLLVSQRQHDPDLMQRHINLALESS